MQPITGITIYNRNRVDTTYKPCVIGSTRLGEMWHLRRHRLGPPRTRSRSRQGSPPLAL